MFFIDDSVYLFSCVWLTTHVRSTSNLRGVLVSQKPTVTGWKRSAYAGRASPTNTDTSDVEGTPNIGQSSMGVDILESASRASGTGTDANTSAAAAPDVSVPALSSGDDDVDNYNIEEEADVPDDSVVALERSEGKQGGLAFLKWKTQQILVSNATEWGRVSCTI